jgi:hypothetical protein
VRLPTDRPQRQLNVDAETFAAILIGTPVDDGLAADIAKLRAEEKPVEHPGGSLGKAS